MPHYHIRWSANQTLDWEVFGTRVEAEARAKQFVRFGETYAIEELDGDCPRCGEAKKAKSQSG